MALVDLAHLRAGRQPGQGLVLGAFERLEERVDLAA
jgi:hypothetical protein